VCCVALWPESAKYAAMQESEKSAFVLAWQRVDVLIACFLQQSEFFVGVPTQRKSKTY
jgi:hypothetical protein